MHEPWWTYANKYPVYKNPSEYKAYSNMHEPWWTYANKYPVHINPSEYKAYSNMHEPWWTYANKYPLHINPSEYKDYSNMREPWWTYANKYPVPEERKRSPSAEWWQCPRWLLYYRAEWICLALSVGRAHFQN